MGRLTNYIFLFFMLCASYAVAQTPGIVSGKVMDETTHEPLVFSAVIVKGTMTSTETNAAGEFTISVSAKKSTLVVFQFGYFTKEYDIGSERTEPLSIELKPKSFQLNEVVVTSKKTDTLQGNNHTLFLAFEFYDNLIVALVNKGKRYNSIQLLDEFGTIIKEHKAPLGVEELFKDCFGNVQLVSKDSSYQFYYNYESILLLKPYPVAVFNRSLKPCQCIAGNNYYFKEITYKNLKHTYYMINRYDLQKKRLFTEVENKDAIKAFNFDFDINYFLSQRKKRDNTYAVTVDDIKANIDRYRENLILSQEYMFRMNPIKSDIIRLDSSLLVVDYTHKLLFKHNFLGGLLKTDSLLLKNILPYYIQDIDLRKIYFVKETSGIMSLFEYKNPGINQKPIVIENFKFIKNVRCRNNTLYFLDKIPGDERLFAKIYKYKL